MTYKTGSIGEFMQWTRRVIAGKATPDAQKQWFDVDATALATLETLPDDQINTVDIPEQRDWTGARRGVFYPIKK